MIKILFVVHAVSRLSQQDQECVLVASPVEFVVAQAQERFSRCRGLISRKVLNNHSIRQLKNSFTVAGERGAIFGQQDGSCEFGRFRSNTGAVTDQRPASTITRCPIT